MYTIYTYLRPTYLRHNYFAANSIHDYLTYIYEVLSISIAMYNINNSLSLAQMYYGLSEESLMSDLSTKQINHETASIMFKYRTV